MTAEPSRRLPALLRLAALVVAFVVAAVALQLSGWDGPEQLRSSVEDAGAWGPVLYVIGYAALVLVPTPASVLTILGGALFGLVEGVLLAWLGAVLGAVGGFAIGRRLGRPAVDRLLGGRLAQADRVLAEHGLSAVLAVRLVPLFPFTPLNYASGLVGVRWRHYLVGSALGMLPGATAYAAVGASGADPLGIVVAAAGLVLLVVAGGWWGRRLLTRQ
ncbi:TVP38/TMEM64 family protein [uncultured Nocardioides sp.]|uniref:TVP38/TMEM64 family protein n=1 Tax=uncultured Nocardioides sp. TaxID=198441 RepID=UPI000C376E74|nr:TVP38/TMEM64 family protein [uncultured Nocardioides sp.]MAO79126.1 TVP38/TMEM64 family protein [Nocardioides sp.]